MCREAEICYQAMAMVTDYDCWHEAEAEVSVEMVIGHLMANTARAKTILARLLPLIPEQPSCACRSALKGAILSDLATAPQETKSSLGPVLAKYMT